MKAIFEITRYKIRLLLISSKYIAPLLCFFFLLYAVYSQATSNLVSMFAVTLGIQFAIGVWMGYICNQLEHPVIEQLMILKVRTTYTYDFSEVCLFLCLAISMSILVVMYPLFMYLVQQGDIIKLMDIGLGFLVHVFVAIMALGVGSFFHPRLIKSKKNILFLTVAVTLLSFATSSAIDQYPMLRAASWVLPPISEILYLLNGLDAFTASKTAKVFGIALGYFGIIKVTKSMLLSKNKF